MTHSELRVGNYVFNYYKEIVMIDRVFIDSQPCGLFPCVGYKHVCSDLGSLSPVKIDDGWLYRFGFNHREEWKSRLGYTYSKDSCPIKIEYCIVERRYVIHKSEESIRDGYLIEYVHELQNLYKDIVGEELKTIDV